MNSQQRPHQHAQDDRYSNLNPKPVSEPDVHTPQKDPDRRTENNPSQYPERHPDEVPSKDPDEIPEQKDMR